jgi:branched-chain amino acid transport system substrate-binding protein
VVRRTPAIWLFCGVAAGALACSVPAPSSGSSPQGGHGCDQSNPVQIGVIQTLSGPSASVGQASQEGLELGVQDVNAAGGILGRCVNLITKDDAGTPAQAISAARELTGQDKVAAVIGPLLSSNTSAVLPVINSAKVLEASVGSPPESLDPTQSPYTYIFGVSAPAGAASFGSCATSGSATRVAVLAVNNALGTDYLTALQAAAGSLGLDIVATQFANTGAVDLTPELRTLQAASPQALILFNTGADIIATLKGREALNWNVPVVGFSTIAADAVVNAIGPSGMTGVYGAGFSYVLVHDAGNDLPSDPAGAAFIKSLQAYYKQNPIQVSAQQRAPEYDAISMVAQAFNSAKTLDSDAARAYLDSNGFQGLLGKYDFSSTTHAGVTTSDLVCAGATTFTDGTYEKATRLE